MSDTPRTDAVVKKVQREEVSFCDAYYLLLELSKDLERSLKKARPPASSKKSGRYPISPNSQNEGDAEV